jgi:hypothetical protein
MRYKAHQNEIRDERGIQIAVVMAANCPKSLARRMAQYVVDRLNADERGKELARLAEQRT